MSYPWQAFASNWLEFTIHCHELHDRVVQKLFCSGFVCYARPNERKPNLNYQFSDDEVALLRLALGVALGRFEDSLDGEAAQMLAYINQPSWSEASQAARTIIEQLSVPGVVVTINARGRSRN